MNRYAQIITADAARLGIEDEALVWVHSRKGGAKSSPARRSAIAQTKGLFRHDLPVVDWRL